MCYDKIKYAIFTDFRLSQWLAVDVNSVLGWLLRVDMSNVASILEVNATCIFRVEVCRMG
jgi:hypothetical protein